jgi:predicted lactoylglutathione lyase
MKKSILFTLILIATFGLGFGLNTIITPASTSESILITDEADKLTNMKTGAFSMSLSVKDLKASKQFYETLGFTAFGGAETQNYLIMKNGSTIIGLFQGMFQGNIITFNPGWDENAQNIKEFDDVRAIQKHLKAHGISLLSEADVTTSGPASIMLTDPDGNMILFDQHR